MKYKLGQQFLITDLALEDIMPIRGRRTVREWCKAKPPRLTEASEFNEIFSLDGEIGIIVDIDDIPQPPAAMQRMPIALYFPKFNITDCYNADYLSRFELILPKYNHIWNMLNLDV